jgi:hypothetical protein
MERLWSKIRNDVTDRLRETAVDLLIIPQRSLSHQSLLLLERNVLFCPAQTTVAEPVRYGSRGLTLIDGLCACVGE